MRLIADGVVDREGVAGLASRLGYSERHLHRCLLEAVGAGPLALARAQRAQTARVLLETTDLRIGELALDRRLRERPAVQHHDPPGLFGRTPRELRALGARAGGARAGRRRARREA